MDNGQLKMDNDEMKVQDTSANCQLSTVNSQLKDGYKQTEVGVIPSDWDVLSLGGLTTYLGSGKSNVRARYGDFPVYGSTGVIGFSNSAEYEGDALLVARVGANAGKLNFVTGKYGVTDNTIIVKLSEKVHLPFFWYQLESKHLNSLIFGSGQPLLTGTQLKALTLVVPKPPEQRVIATTLSDVDALITALDKLIAKKRAIKIAAMQQLLAGKQRLPGFNADWEYKKIGEFTDCTAGGTPSTAVASYWGGNIKWMSSGELHLKTIYDVEGRITGAGLKNSSTKIIPPNCVLVGLAGQGKTRGTVAINTVELCTNQSIAAIYPNDSFDPKYLFYNLDNRYDELRGLSTGDGGRGGLNLTIIRNVSVPFPLKDEQTAIATVLSDMDAEIAALEARRDKTKTVKQGMMQELLTGKTRLMDNGQVKMDN